MKLVLSLELYSRKKKNQKKSSISRTGEKWSLIFGSAQYFYIIAYWIWVLALRLFYTQCCMSGSWLNIQSIIRTYRLAIQCRRMKVRESPIRWKYILWVLALRLFCTHYCICIKKLVKYLNYYSHSNLPQRMIVYTIFGRYMLDVECCCI